MKRKLTIWVRSAVVLAFPVNLWAQPNPFTDPASSRPTPEQLGDFALPGRAPAPGVTLGPLSLAGSQARLGQRTDTTRFEASVQTSSLVGRGMSINVARLMDDQWAAGAHVTQGPRRREVMVSGLWSPMPDLHVRLSVGQLRETRDFDFYSGVDSVSLSQNSWLLRLKKTDVADGRWGDWGVQVYGARAREPEVADRLITKEIGSVTEWWVDPRRVSPGALTGARLNWALRPWARGQLELNLGRERLAYAFFDGSASVTRRLASSVQWTQSFDHCQRLQTRLADGASGLQWDVQYGVGRWLIGHSKSLGRVGLPGDSRWRVAYQFPIDARPAACAVSPRDVDSAQNGTTRSRFSRLDEVFARPAELPSMALAQVDRTAVPYLVARIDQAQLPPGAQVTASPGKVSVATGTAVLGVGVIERDGMAIPNAGSQGGSLVSVQGGRVDINLNQFPPPSPGGQDNYRILMPQAGGQVIEINFTVVNR